VKLLLLLGAGVLLPDRGVQVIYATWCLGQAVSLVALAIIVVRGQGVRVQTIPRPRIPHALRGAALVHHAFNLALSAPSWILPLIATVLVSATANAYFYTAWTVAAFAFVGPLALTTVLYAAASQPSRELGRPLQASLLLSLFWAILATGGCALLGSRALGFFGHNYGLHAGPVVLVLALSVFPQVAKLHYVALVRIRDRFSTGILLVTAGGLLEIGLSAFGASHGGIRGLAVGYLVANCVEAFVVIPTIVRSVVQTLHDRSEQAHLAPVSRSPRARQRQPGAGHAADDSPHPGPLEQWTRP
jgi:O-antigen/teichoic acid export membrane protein